MTGADFAEKLTAWVAAGRSGAIEWCHDRRRRLFFLAGGELALLQSNLKSESLQRVGEQTGFTGDQLRREVSLRRLRAMLQEEEGALVEHPGVPAPEFAPEDVMSLLWESADLLPRPVGYPSVRHVALLRRLPVPEGVSAVLHDVDGDRSVDDLVAFSPADPELLLNALSLAALLGALEVAAELVPQAHVVATPRPGADAGPTAATASPAAATAAQDEEPTNLDEMAAQLQESTGPAPAILVEGSTHEVTLPPRAPSLEATLGVAASRIRDAQTHFEVLDIPWDAPPDVTRKAYLQLARELHPDKWSSASALDRAAAERIFERVRAAWEVLGLESSRRAYTDRVIHGQKTEEELAAERMGHIMEGELEYKRGLVELQANRIAPANDLFTRARAKLPDDDEVKVHAAYTTYRVNAGRNEERAAAALAELVDTVRKNDRLDQGLVLLGMIEWQRGREAEAKARFIAALRIRPSNPDALRELKRLQRAAEPDGGAPTKEKEGSGFLSRIFKKK